LFAALAGLNVGIVLGGILRGVTWPDMALNLVVGILMVYALGWRHARLFA
jgi:hypothetical protein